MEFGWEEIHCKGGRQEQEANEETPSQHCLSVSGMVYKELSVCWRGQRLELCLNYVSHVCHRLETMVLGWEEIHCKGGWQEQEANEEPSSQHCLSVSYIGLKRKLLVTGGGKGLDSI